MQTEVLRVARGSKAESPADENVRLKAELVQERAANERYRLAAQSATNLIYEWDLGKRVQWYGKVDELLGYEPKRFPRTLNAWMSRLHPEDRERVLAAVEKHLKSEEPYCMECRVKRKDGTYLYWLDRGSVVYDAAGKPCKWIGAVTDITERKRAEKQVEESASQLRQMMEGTVKAISSALEFRDPYTHGHEKRVAELSVAIATEMGLPASQVEGIRITAYMHDLGKIAIPAEILFKPGKLTDHEFSIVKTHPQFGYDILKEIHFAWPVALATLQHHERLNGSGYPQGLKADAILLEARILGVADVVETMASHRSYRPALGLDAALKEISANKGILFDADVVDACVRVFKERGFRFDAASFHRG
jgi:PAS domain S-box-containing protein